MGFGHKFSCVLVTPESTVPDTTIPKGFTDVWGRIAADIAMYDTRGCMSPSLVFTTHPLDLAMQSLSAAMARAEARWPRGEISAYEGAKIRERIILGKTVGRVELGQNYAVIGVPLSFATLSALPRCIHVIHVETIEPFLSFVQEHAVHLSTIGTNLSAMAQLHRAGPKTRICALGRMQRPHIQRLHDGVDWIKELFEAH